jgi:hypothetical protein
MAAGLRNGLGFGISPLFIAIAERGALNGPWSSPRISGFINKTPMVKTWPHLDKVKEDHGIILKILITIIQVKKEKRVEVWSNG